MKQQKLIANQKKQIEELEAKMLAITQSGGYVPWKDKMDENKDKLINQLVKYTCHKLYCDISWTRDTYSNSSSCTCGLDEALEAARKAGK